MQKRLIVIGGGAAGFFCAVNAARMNPSLEVIILEKSSKTLRKVRVSGGGRCNVTHACFEMDELSRKYPRGARFIRKTAHQFFTTDTVEWFRARQVELKTESDGRMFPASNSSQTIIDCLLKEATQYKVTVQTNRAVESLLMEAPRTGGKRRFLLSVVNTHDPADKREHTADFVCIACGGYPKSSMFEWLLATGHHIEAPVPSLFTFNMPGSSMTRLMGISVENAKVKIAGSKLETSGPLLITHWGLSGPAILKLSAWGARELAEKNYQCTAIINWLPPHNENSLREKFNQLRLDLARQQMGSKCPFGLPIRLWQYFLEQSAIGTDRRWADLPAAAQHKLIKLLCLQECTVEGKTTFKEEFVTAGGIKLNEVDAQTMMSKIVPDLFFAGEILDVDGITGGFNFQHAWSSGWIAAQAIAGRDS